MGDAHKNEFDRIINFIGCYHRPSANRTTHFFHIFRAYCTVYMYSGPSQNIISIKDTRYGDKNIYLDETGDCQIFGLYGPSETKYYYDDLLKLITPHSHLNAGMWLYIYRKMTGYK